MTATARWFLHRKSLRGAERKIVFVALLKIVGLALLSAFVALDALVRIRMKSIGYKWVFLRGGTFDYAQYLNVRTKYGWSAWPVYLLWASLVSGLPLFVIGCISH